VVWLGYVACMAEMRNALKTVVEKSEGERQFGRPKRRHDVNNKMKV